MRVSVSLQDNFSVPDSDGRCILAGVSMLSLAEGIVQRE